MLLASTFPVCRKGVPVPELNRTDLSHLSISTPLLLSICWTSRLDIQPAMRSPRILPAVVVLLLMFLQPTRGNPLQLEENEQNEKNDLEKRCANPCGYQGWLCCGSNQVCGTTSDGEAACYDSQIATTSSYWQYYTTTYLTTETDVSTVTSTWSSLLTAPPAAATCRASIGETVCGDRCCEAAFECVNGECVQGSSSAVYPTPPVLGTSSGFSTVTETAAPTTTEPFIAPVNSDGVPVTGAKASNNGNLSGGAIAGIVIGSLAGLALLLLLLFLCMRGRRRTETTVVEQHYSHHSHGGGGGGIFGRTWFGSRPNRPSRVDEGKTSSGWGSLATIGIILGAIALCLGLRRRERNEKSDYTSTTGYTYDYYSDYYTNTASSESSDRRTRRSRHSRSSRPSRSRRS